MKAKRMLSLLLTAALMLSMVTPVLAASAETELPRASQTRLEETNEVVSIRLQAAGKLVYGSPFELSVVTRPADAQYIGVVLGVKGEAKGYVTLVLSDKLRTLLKMIPLPRKMSKTPDQVEEFNVYAYVKQLIDGNDVSVLLGVADEVVKVMDTLKFYIPTLKDMSMGLKLSLELIRRYLPEGAFSRIYLDEQPVDFGQLCCGCRGAGIRRFEHRRCGHVQDKAQDRGRPPLLGRRPARRDDAGRGGGTQCRRSAGVGRRGGR